MSHFQVEVDMVVRSLQILITFNNIKTYNLDK